MSLGAEVPEGWTQRRLGECAGVNSEQLGSKTDPDFLLEYLDIGAIERPGTIGGSRKFRFGDAPSRARRLAQDGDVLVSTVRPYLRNFARIRKAPDNLVVSTGYAVVRPSGDVEGDFLYQHILSDKFVGFLERRMSGSNYPAVTASDVEAYPLSLPPLAQQRKFGAVLRSVDDAIERTQAVIDQLRVVKRGLMEELLTQGQRDGGICATKRPTKVRPVPENWEAVTLGDITTVVGGGTPSRSQSNYWNGGVPWATPTDVTALGGRVISKTASTITNSGLANSSATLLPPNSLLVTTRATIGACAISAISMATNQGFQNLVPKKGVCVEFLYYLIQHNTRNLERLGAGSTYLEIPKRVFSRFAVFLPPLVEQRRIATVLSSLDDTIQFELEATDRYKAVKRSLMSVLLTGKLRVTPDPQAA